MLNAIGLANPGRERVFRRDAAAAARARACRSGSRSAASRPPTTRRRARGCSRRSGDRAQPLVPERRRGAGIGGRDRRRLPRGDALRSTRSSRRMPGTSARPCARSKPRARTGSASSTRCAAWRSTPTLAPGARAWAGGYSGAALKPVALAAVHAARRATTLPIVGMGGVATGRDALELIACGANDVALGTVLFADPDAPTRVRGELDDGDAKPGMRSTDEAFCAAHDDRCQSGQLRPERRSCTGAERLVGC